MKNIMKKTGIAIMAASLAVSGFLVSPKAAQAAEAPNVNANAAIAIEESTGKILYSKDADKLMGIASMTKMMDEYLLLEAIDKGQLKWDDKVTISEYAFKVSQDTSLSNVPLRLGEDYTVQELYEAMAIYSANGAAIALSEKIAGSEKDFVDAMNKKAEKLGLGEHKFVNSTGLNNEDLKGEEQVGGPKDENQMTARGMAKLAKHLIDDYPDVLKTASITKKEFRKGTSDQIDMSNWNWLLPGLIYGRQGVDGLKTGTTDYAGMCLTATAVQDGMRVITVVLHANGGAPGAHTSARFDETNKMLDYAFNNFKVKEVQKAGSKVKDPSTLAVNKGKEDTVGLVTKDAVKLVVPKNDNSPKLNTKVTLKEKKIEAPVEKGTTVGEMEVSLKDGDDLGYLDGKQTETIDVQTASDVEKANWFMLSAQAVGSFFTGIGSYVSNGVQGWFN
ncbi:D-alanyl-D-alanine carboxypeptidase PBPD1 [Listeria cossartiae subsp. cayugensis]|uniref:D-alanyl-D-alanine carboxypeptidase PBPD1 n=1 Tax=Listeria cossartiae TaxID=2838249 RepID=UPI00288016C4|nr:D-alanyl-D-alanine carboxypeptidase PBPD1 [Listeria cossartiae]MDT0000899.1 D-alanyl-D-alanine carboxypeptidase PBPD1 [Listeria cossartiae subsp. cayugensis]MDT0003998.1 D-alanyl-D-alanine carboxypeptidase PBPD1 [Listeria cossartiae subsp. cayugensis]MDT0008997.1 D-alanyl-D-alanine carboxypeptidase PBPD1 [Listeria cossartiae subsp. cayugensis]MDT0020392.1 D-alanyl-D-alanine carboxypeptidase PBPD1 [Listeria cossartiae subsp. cayugensis]MDT0030829.1 D-alanyl-D-alanine carboxypeptidase PBPD1 [